MLVNRKTNMKNVIFITNEAVASHCGAMEADTISKNGRSLKSHMSKINSFLICIIIFVICGFYSCGDPTIVSVCEVLSTKMFDVRIDDVNLTNSGLVLRVTYINTDNESRYLLGTGELFFERDGKEYTFDNDDDYAPTPLEVYTDALNPFSTITFRVRFKVPKELYSASCYYIPARYDNDDYRIFLGTLASPVSCGVFPGDYKDAIEDAVKFYISYANVHINTMLNNDDKDRKIYELNEMREVSEEVWATIEQSNAFELILNEWLTTKRRPHYINYASPMLKWYRELKISLSDFKEVESSTKRKTWSFKESNNDIEFIFEYTVEDNTFSIIPVVDSLEDYILYHISSD